MTWRGTVHKCSSRFLAGAGSHRWLLALFPLAFSAGSIVAEARLIGDASGVVQGSPVVSPDGAHLALVVLDAKTKSRHVIVDGEKLGGDYDSIAAGTPLFSPNGHRVAFVARRGKECTVVWDGVESPAYPVIGEGWPVADLVFSPDGEALAYKLRTAGKTVLAIDGRWTWRSGPYDDAIGADNKTIWGIWDFQFSLDGRGFLYRGKVGDKMVAAWGYIPLNDRKGSITVECGPPHDSIGRGTPVWSTNRPSKQGATGIGYIAVDDKQEFIEFLPAEARTSPRVKLPRRVRSDMSRPEEEEGTWDAIARGSLACPPGQAKRLDYVACRGGKWSAVISGRPGPPFDEIGTILYSPDGDRYAYAARNGPRVCLVVDGQAGPSFEGVQYPLNVFSPDGKTVVYAARTPTSSVLMVDGKQVASYDRIDAASIVFSPDARHLAFAAGTKDKSFVVLDSKAGPPFDEVSGLRLGEGGQMAYRARNGLKVFVVTGTTLSEPYDLIAPLSPVISPDGRRVAWAAMKQATWNVVVDGKAGPPCQEVPSTIAFSATSRHMAYVGKFGDDGKTAYGVVVDQQTGPRYTSVWMRDGGRLTFRPDDTLLFFARNSALIYRVAVGSDVPSPDIHLSSLVPLAPSGGQTAPLEKDRSATGSPLRICGQEFARGVGVKTLSELTYSLPDIFMEKSLRGRERKHARGKGIPPVRFVALAGVDDSAAPDAGVVFQVFADENKLAESPLLRRGEFHAFAVPLSPAARRLRLVATGGKSAVVGIPADWCDAGLVLQDD
ncbi:MAG TPA: NPCBM/NEW2 domain-containing protein [Phycisphaerae bacterium]|nr:NPCBM/NEW2 domain-containing protein [Phycisphaerae bacterium]HQL73795.1 NPCBM/NEW2 domain-containing protein [Phycisphaerae bacterium]